MTFEFSDFEGEAVGTIPSGWTLIESNANNDPSPYTRVVDQNTIEGSRSFRIGDAATSGQEEVRHPIGDEDIRFVGTFTRETFFGDSISVTLSSPGDWWWRFWTDDSQSDNPFRVFYGTGSPPNDDLDEANMIAAADAEAGSVSSGFHRIEVIDTSTSLKLVIDGGVLYDTGDSFSGQSQFAVRADDLTLITDTPEALYSNYVNIEGQGVRLQTGTQTFVEEGLDGEARLVADTSDSKFVQIEGEPVEDQQG